MEFVGDSDHRLLRPEGPFATSDGGHIDVLGSGLRGKQASLAVAVNAAPAFIASTADVIVPNPVNTIGTISGCMRTKPIL